MDLFRAPHGGLPTFPEALPLDAVPLGAKELFFSLGSGSASSDLPAFAFDGPAESCVMPSFEALSVVFGFFVFCKKKEAFGGCGGVGKPPRGYCLFEQLIPNWGC